jgi:DNA-directed RNA polymerase subunit H (RpoH/RPB5)
MNKDQIIKSFGTILEMLSDRGIQLPVNMSAAHLAETLESETVLKNIIEVKINNIKLIYYTPQKFKWADLKKQFEESKEDEHHILVLCENMTQNNVKSIHSSGASVEIHLVTRLQFNITKHVLVPKHEVIKDKAEIDDILRRYKLKSRHQLPIILKTDPIAKYYAMRSGDVVKITRTSETAGEYIVYRCCL